MLKRTIEKNIDDYLQDEKNHKVLFIWGPRRSGKTTLLEKISKRLKLPIFNFDLISSHEQFTPDENSLSKLAKSLKVILIDEVQNCPQSTVALKILHDVYKCKIIATGSSELRQKNDQFDSLAGRYVEIFCLPLSLEESIGTISYQYQEKKATQDSLNHFLVYGAYPEIYLEKEGAKKINLLQGILDSYIIKDIVSIYNLKNAKLAKDILLKIALQAGSEVSLREIANSLQTTVPTVGNYIEIFIKNYVLIALPSFKTNLRRAVSENRKFYFYDLGIRNILVKDFREPELRPDKGGIFENLVVSEVEKFKKVHSLKFSSFFYREFSGKEIDLVLESYWKKYLCWEIKTAEEKVKHFFPLGFKTELVYPDNLFEKIKLLSSFGKPPS